MATRDETVRFAYKVTGIDEVDHLAQSILGVGDASAETQTEVQRLANDLAAISATKSAAGKYQELAKAQSAFGAAVEAAGLKLKLASEQQSANTAALDKADQALKQAKQAAADYTQQTGKTVEQQAALKRAVKDAGTAQREASAAWKASNKALRDAEAGYKSAVREQKQLDTQLGELDQSLKRAGVSAKNLGDAQAELAQRGARVRAAMEKLLKVQSRAAIVQQRIAAATKKWSQELHDAGSSAISFSKKLLQLSGIAGAVTAALSAIGGVHLFGKALASAAEFEQTMTEVYAVAGANTKQMILLKKAAEDTGAAYGYTGTQAAQALGELVRATGDANTAIAQLPATLALAKGGAVDMATAAQFVVQTMAQFGLGATQASHVADTLAKTANVTATSVEGVGNAMSYAAPLAKQLGLTMDDTAAAIGVMANNGYQGERAGTALRAVFQSMLDPTTAFSVSLKKLGIDTTNFQTTITGLAAAGDAGRTAILTLQAQAVPAILSLVQDGGKGLRQLSSDLRASGGAAVDTATKFSNTFTTAKDRILAAFGFLSEKLLTNVLGPLKGGLNTAAEAVREFAASADFTKLAKAISDFASRGIAAITRFVASVDFTAAIQSITEFLSGAGGKFAKWSTVVGNVAASCVEAAGVIGRAFDLIKAAVFGTAAAITKMAQGAVLALALVSGTYAKMADVIGGLGAVSEEFARRATQAWHDVTGATESAAVANRSAAHSVDRVKEASDRAALAQHRFKDAVAQSNRELDEIARREADASSASHDAAQSMAEFTASLAAATDVDRVKTLGQALEGAMDDGRISAEQYIDALNEVKKRLKQIKGDADDKEAGGKKGDDGKKDDADKHIKKLSADYQDLGRSAKQANKQISETSAHADDAANAIADMINGWSSYFAGISQEALDQFQRMNAAAISANTTVGGYLMMLGKASQGLKDSILDEQKKLKDLSAALAAVGTDGQAAFGAWRAGLDGTQIQLRNLSDAVRVNVAGFELLGEKDLGPLRKAITDAEARVKSLQDAAKAADDQIKDMGSSLQDQIDQINGNNIDIENRRYKEQLKHLADLAEKSGNEHSKEYRDAVAKARQLHALKLKQIREEAAAKKKEEDQPDTASKSPPNQPDTHSSGGSSASRALPGINIQLYSTVTDPRTLDDFARKIKVQLDAIARRSR